MAEPAKILVNQVGYDLEKEKRFVVQAGEGRMPTRFSVVNRQGKCVYRGVLRKAGNIAGWGACYWAGDFSPMRVEGTLRILVRRRRDPVFSYPFRVGRALVFEETGELAQRFFYYQRCGTEVEGWHAPCHLDDGAMPDGSHLDVSGGWHDAGDYNKYNGCTPLSVFALSYAYEKCRSYYDGFKTSAGTPTIVDEALWGARWLLKMQPEPGRLLDRVFSGYSYWGPPEKETDNVPGNRDDRPILGETGPWACALASAAFARLSPWGEGRFYLDVANALWEKARTGKGHLESDAALLLADQALYAKTGRQVYMDDSSMRIASILARQTEEGWFALPDGSPHYSITQLGFPAACLAEFKLSVQPDTNPEVAEAVTRYLDFSIKIARNPFQISTTYSKDGSISFFYRYPEPAAWYVGQNSQYLSQAWAALLGFALTRHRRFRKYALAQLNWVLGTNPFGICMFEGKGSVNPAVYHHRYNAIPRRERGAVPGCVPNGIVRMSVDKDAPRFDLRSSGRPDYQSNEPWLPHNSFYLLAASSL